MSPSSTRYRQMQERFERWQNSPLLLAHSELKRQEELPALELILCDEEDESQESQLASRNTQKHRDENELSTDSSSLVSSSSWTSLPHMIRLVQSHVSDPNEGCDPPLHHTDVHICHSEECLVCRPRKYEAGRQPVFLQAPPIAPQAICQLPPHWWTMTHSTPGGRMSGCNNDVYPSSSSPEGLVGWLPPVAWLNRVLRAGDGICGTLDNDKGKSG